MGGKSDAALWAAAGPRRARVLFPMTADRGVSSVAPLVTQHDSYHAALKHCKHGPWYVDVHMSTAQITWPLFNSVRATEDCHAFLASHMFCKQ